MMPGLAGGVICSSSQHSCSKAGAQPLGEGYVMWMEVRQGHGG